MDMVSTDGHIIEPPDMFEALLPSKYVERAPRVVGNSKLGFNWEFDGTRPRASLNRHHNYRGEP